jgi:hypothetical protein
MWCCCVAQVGLELLGSKNPPNLNLPHLTKIFVCLFCVVLGTIPRFSGMLGKCPITVQHSQPPKVVFDMVLFVCLDLPRELAPQSGGRPDFDLYFPD